MIFRTRLCGSENRSSRDYPARYTAIPRVFEIIALAGPTAIRLVSRVQSSLTSDGLHPAAITIASKATTQNIARKPARDLGAPSWTEVARKEGRPTERGERTAVW